MNEIKKVFEGVKGGWNNIDKKKKIALIVVVIALLLSISLITHFSQKVTYITLFNELSLEDAGVIVNDLETKKIKYVLENQGRKILIDEKQIDKYRLQLAMEGNMPENSPGFEMFDDIGLMVTDEDRKIMYQRALTGELQKSIMSLDAVNTAKVHLVMSEKSIFETKASEASASIIVDLNPEYKISTNMIKGIAALASGAVENLPEENIQIIDSKGNVLSNVLREDKVNSTDLLNEYQTLKEDFEYKMESNLMDLLGGIFGRDKIKVMVYADLDFDGEESTVIRYENPVTRSEQLEVSGDNINTQEVTGGNIGDNTSNVIESVTGNGSTYNRIINNELTTETINTIKAPGKINRMTTSVVYDGNISDERILQIENIVASATGFDEGRGDSINVDGIVFDKTYQNRLDAELEEVRRQEEGTQGMIQRFYSQYRNLVNIGLIIFALSAVITFIITRITSKRKKEAAIFNEEVPIYASTQDEHVDDSDSVEIEIKSNNNEKKAQNYAKEHPDIAADLIRAWMKN
ncbi:MAG: flagellar basal-body MS-ring/collar protein FliF [Tissierellaceae bacterium]|nr:flagellar basal-body MS-ring/collar protein FliF [Tissierellaceae bacterium]